MIYLRSLLLFLAMMVLSFDAVHAQVEESTTTTVVEPVTTTTTVEPTTTTRIVEPTTTQSKTVVEPVATGIDANSNTTTTRVIVTSPVPPLKETLTIPPGYINCFDVAAGYYNGVWVSARRVCQYNTPGKAAWIGGYWRCMQYTSGGVCTNWNWIPSHWSGTLTVY